MWHPFVTKSGVLFIKTDAPEKERLTIHSFNTRAELTDISSYYEQNSERLFHYPTNEKAPLVYNYPALPVALSNKEKDLLEKEPTTSLCGGTVYGSPQQDKSANEDFALVSALPDKSVVGIVADGVSTRNFWPERASRIAVLQTVKFLSSKINQVTEKTDLYDHTERLKKSIIQALEKDKATLLSGGFEPLGATSSVFDKHKGKDFWWYQTTLNFVHLSSEKGYIFNVGDGGIVVRVGDTEKDLLKGARGNLTNYFSLNEFYAVPRVINLGTPSAKRKVTVFLSTDGVDESVRRNKTSYFDMGISGQSEIDGILEELSNDNQPSLAKREMDNCSLVKVQWPQKKDGKLTPQGLVNLVKPSKEPVLDQVISLSRMRHNISEKIQPSLFFTDYYFSMAIKGVASPLKLTDLGSRLGHMEIEDPMTERIQKREERLINNLAHYEGLKGNRLR